MKKREWKELALKQASEINSLKIQVREQQRSFEEVRTFMVTEITKAMTETEKRTQSE